MTSALIVVEEMGWRSHKAERVNEVITEVGLINLCHYRICSRRLMFV